MSPHNIWDNIADIRHRQLISGSDITWRLVFLPLWQNLSKRVGGDQTHLAEIGSGTGVLAKAICPCFGDIDCFDTSEKSVMIARDYLKDIGHIRIYHSDQSLMRESRYDACFAHMVLHLIPDLPKFLVTVSRALRPLGVFWFSIPHPCFYHEYKKEAVSLSDYRDERELPLPFRISREEFPEHPVLSFYHRTLQKYATQLTEANFSIVGIEEPLPPASAMAEYSAPWTAPRYMFVGAQRRA